MYFEVVLEYAVISGSLSPWHGASSGCCWRKDLQYGGQLLICWISSLRQPTRGGHPALVVGRDANYPSP